MSLQALTANDLLTGEPVFRRGAAWAGRLPDAYVYADADAAAQALALAKAEATAVVDPYLIDCVMEGEVAVPISYRERVRALGPTVHPDMGKQAEGGEAVRVLQAATGSGRSAGRVSLIARKT